MEPVEQEVPVEPEIIVRRGNGKFVFPDGSTFEGEWEQDGDQPMVRQGAGTFTFGPETFVGTWVNDVMTGEG